MKDKINLYLMAFLLLCFASACSLAPRTAQPQNQQGQQEAEETQIAQTADAQDSVETLVAQTVSAQEAAATEAAQTQAAQATPEEDDEDVGDGATETPDTPTHTPEPTPTPTKTFQPVIGVDKLNLGGPNQLYQFEVNELMFAYAGSNDRAEFEDEKFVFSIDDPIASNLWSFSAIEAKNFYVEVTIEMPTCSGKDRAGIIFRTPTTSYDLGYIFLISCDGQYQLIRRDSPTTFTELIKWQSHNSINTNSGAVNRIGVWAKDNQIQLFVNAIEVDDINDPVYVDVGKIGLVIGVQNTQDYRVEFDDFAYWQLP